MTTRVGLMGFGRIGRNIFRVLSERDDIHVAAISDIANHKNLEYLLKYDTIMGRFEYDAAVEGSNLYCRGQQTAMLDGRNPGDVDWGAHDVDVVIEATPRTLARAELQKHVDSGAGKVITCTPMSDEPDATVVWGLNEDSIKADDKIISNSSITSHCAGLILKLIDDAFGVERFVFTTTHAYTNDQSLGDVPARGLRRSRAASENIIPTLANNAAPQLETLFPHLKGKITGASLKVPVSNGSLVDMVTFTKKPTSVEAVNAVIKSAASSDYQGLVEYITDPVVSSDMKRNSHSAGYDSLATLALDDHLIKTIAWFDNGWGYAHRVVDLVGKVCGGQS